jgi:integrase/recombinase XerC/integrase/recombinase XerD
MQFSITNSNNYEVNTPIEVLPITLNYVEEFLADSDIRDTSKKSYRRAIKPFFAFISDQNMSELDHRAILSYKNRLKDNNLSAYTITFYLVVLRRFFIWLESNKIYPNIARNVKGMVKPNGWRKESFTMEQIKDICAMIDKDTIQGKRDFAIINLLVRTGLRIIEIQRANIGDISQSGGEAKLYIQGKGRDSKDDFVILTHTTLQPVMEYLSSCRKGYQDNQPLFASMSDRNYGQRMTTRSISRLIKNSFIRAGIDSPKLTPHSLRHTAITTALVAGATLQEVKTMARHSDINTTLIYSHNIDRVANAPERKIDEYMADFKTSI